MAAKLRLNKTILSGLVSSGDGTTVQDREVSGLKFRVGKKRSVFQFEKRISGSKKAPVTVTIGAFPAISLEEARQEARRLANLCERGIDPRAEKEEQAEPTSLLFSDAIALFFQTKSELSRRTREKYMGMIRCHFDPAMQKKDVRMITPEMLVEVFHRVRANARADCWEILKLFRNIWNTCAPFYRDNRNVSLLGECPVRIARQMLQGIRRDPRHRPVIPKQSLGKFVVEVERLRDTTHRVAQRRLCNTILLSLFTAFRSVESRSLKWEYVDLEEGVIRLPGTVNEPGQGFRGTKNGRDHVVPLSSYPLQLLRDVYEHRVTMSPFVFPQTYNPSKPISNSASEHRQISELVGFYFAPHACRRTFASVADEIGIGFLTVKRMLNHAFEGGVTGGYIVQSFNPSKQREHFQRVCDYILECRTEFLEE